jgi:hypothetical protein
MAAPAILRALITTFQTAPRGIEFSHAISGRATFLEAYPGKEKPLKGAKNKPRVLQSYVTYDTLRSTPIAQGPIFTIRLWKALQ